MCLFSLLFLCQFHAHRVGVVLALRDLAAALLLFPALLGLPLRPSLDSIPYCAPDETPVHLALRVETRRAITQFHGPRHITLCPFDPPLPQHPPPS